MTGAWTGKSKRVAQPRSRLDKLKILIGHAQDKGREDLVARLRARLEKTQTAHDHVVDFINRIQETCGV